MGPARHHFLASPSSFGLTIIFISSPKFPAVGPLIVARWLIEGGDAGADWPAESRRFDARDQLEDAVRLDLEEVSVEMRSVRAFSAGVFIPQ